MEISTGSPRCSLFARPTIWLVGQKFFWYSVLSFCLSLGLSLVSQVSAQELPPASSAEIRFAEDVQPIFDKHCVECHGASKQTSDLRLDLRSAILKGSGNGAVVELGKSAESRLIEVVAGLDPDYRMPPEGDALTAAEIGILRAWIDQGAKGPDDQQALERPLPWSFKPIVKPESPDGVAALDYWLERKLADKGLKFSVPAERPLFIRRLYLVALGVPPTPAEVEQYVNDSRADAVEQLVDRVLADQRYGERLARHWFDVIRFAESNGFETNRVRYNAWPFRDYVIEAFNKDKPYNQFVSEQIAGDALGADLGTGFLVAGTFDIVKSPDINLTLMQRQDELADLINTTGTAFLGLTLGCARCHDHKFDPITQKDFYSLQAVYAGVNFAERNVPRERSPEQKEKVEMLSAQLAELDKKLRQFTAKAEQEAAVKGLRTPVNARQNEEDFSPITAVAVRFTITESGGSQPCLDEWEVYDANGTNVALASAGSKAAASSTLPGYAIHQLEHINDGRSGNNFSWISNETNGGNVELTFAAPQTIQRMIWGRDRSEQFKDRVATKYSIEAKKEDGTWVEIANGTNRRPATGDATQALIAFLSESEKSEYQSLSKVRSDLQNELNALTQGQAAWIGTFSQPGTIHRLYRGDPLMPREEVLPGTVASLNGIELKRDVPEQERRLALAKWIVDPANPLTSRVMVNRLWQFTFGTGIVDTPSDFGGNGTLPVHPELLDWLAYEFMDNGWSIKHIHRQLFLSKAFLQSSQPNSDGLAIDVDSRYLWRFPPRRLEAEAIRDSMLVASGVIDYRMGGPGFYLQRVEQDNVYRYFPKEEVGPEEYRRMVYLTRIRQEQDPVFGAFDCPSGNQVIPKRSRSNTPLQALNLFNSPFVMQQSKILAERLLREAGEDKKAQVKLAFKLMMGREADSYEVDLSVDLLEREGAEAFCRAMFNASEFLFVF
jgi:mono/diheme cytochrome c family protein